jgi:hypothetical protein
MFSGIVVETGLVDPGSEPLILAAFGTNDSLDGETKSGAGVVCGTC